MLNSSVGKNAQTTDLRHKAVSGVKRTHFSSSEERGHFQFLEAKKVEVPFEASLEGQTDGKKAILGKGSDILNV